MKTKLYLVIVGPVILGLLAYNLYLNAIAPVGTPFNPNLHYLLYALIFYIITAGALLKRQKSTSVKKSKAQAYLEKMARQYPDDPKIQEIVEDFNSHFEDFNRKFPDQAMHIETKPIEPNPNKRFNPITHQMEDVTTEGKESKSNV